MLLNVADESDVFSIDFSTRSIWTINPKIFNKWNVWIMEAK